MVSTFWLQLYSSIAQAIGFNSAATATLFSFIWAVGIALIFMGIFEREKYGHGKELGLFVFYGMLGFFALTGALDWYVFAIVIIVGVLTYKAIGKD